MNTAEEKASEVSAKSLDIKSVEAKFDKVENLMMDLSTKHKQISTLSKRVETLKVDTEDMREGLEELLQEAEDKFQKLSDYLHHVEAFTETHKSITVPKSNSKESKNENLKKKKATIINLYENYAWSPEVISEKLNMDLSLVEEILKQKV